MSDNIPFEIQMEIIKKVSDVKSLILFRSVSKPWKTFIDTSKFITSYGATPTNRLLVRYKDNSNEVKYLSFVDDDTLTQQQMDFAPNVCDFLKQLDNFEVYGSSHGLLCLYGNNHRKVFVLWNPSIGKFVDVLPRYHMPLNDRFFGFVVSPVTNDPTIVKFSYLNQVAIFTLSSKRWRFIPCTILPHKFVECISSHIVIDTCIYWVVFNMFVDKSGDYPDSYMIMSFDFFSQEFKIIGIPNSLRNVWPRTVRFFLSKLRESLVLFASNEEVCGAWKMERDESFTKLFTISKTGYTINNILGFRKNGELVMETQKKDEQFATLELYEPCSEHVNNLGIYGEKGSFFMDSYKETLLLLNHSNGCVYPHFK